MLLLLSGEGPSDLGRCAMPVGQCDGDAFEAGPMAVLVDQIVQEVLSYSVLRDVPACLRYVSKQLIGEAIGEQRQNKRMVALTGKKRAEETGYFMKMAWAFGTLAQQIEAKEGDCAVAVFFRDSDGTRSLPDGAWAEKWVSIEQGFVRARFERGVPMLPKPTSEAWLLCAAKAAPYQNCRVLEDLPGNQESARHPKRELARAFGEEKSSQALREWLEEQPFDPDRAMEMGSYRAFRERLVAALENVRRREQ